MKKKIWLLTVKIVAILIWAFMFFIPDIYERIENVELVGYREIEEESTATYKSLELEFSKSVLYGHVLINFYDENDKVVYGEIILFKDSTSKYAEIEVDNENIIGSIRYEIKEAYATTSTELKVDKISMMLAATMFVVVIAVIRIDYEEKVVDGKTVAVYSGLINHRVKIDGANIFSEKWFTLFKGREVLLEVNEKTDINVMFSLMNKIDFEVVDKPMEETVKESKEPQEEKVEEKKAAKKKTNTASKNGKKKVVSGATTKAKLTVKTTSKNQKAKK